MKITFLLFVLLISIGSLNAQVFTMSNGVVSACSGYFYDSGGQNEKYKPNEDKIFTINSLAGTDLSIEFSEFVLSEGDWLSVYDGNSIDSDLIDTYTKENSDISKLKSETGSLTFVFHSGPDGGSKGWIARIECPGNLTSGIPNNYSGAAYILIYSIRGIKTQSDAALLDKHLKTLGLALETSFNIEKENVWITVTDMELTYIIKDALLDTKVLLGYEISVDYLTNIQAKTRYQNGL